MLFNIRPPLPAASNQSKDTAMDKLFSLLPVQVLALEDQASFWLSGGARRQRGCLARRSAASSGEKKSVRFHTACKEDCKSLQMARATAENTDYRAVQARIDACIASAKEHAQRAQQAAPFTRDREIRCLELCKIE
jgi:hypothetical protein